MTFYLSELLGNPIINQTREKIGVLEDLVVNEIEKDNPKLHGLIIKRGRTKKAVFIPIHDVAEIGPRLIRLSTDVVNLSPYVQRENEFRLGNDVYDKQIVDIDDRRLTRVNDLLLQEKAGIIFLKGVDVSPAGLLHRLHIPVIPLLKRNIVDWNDVQFLGGNLPVKFKVHYKNLESMHPVDIARIIFEGPGYKMGSRVLSQLNEPLAADIIEELSPKLQKNLIESMKIEEVADVIEHMAPDKATDLLLSLGPVYTQKIMAIVNLKTAKSLKVLLDYPETTTGAYMTTDYLAVPAGLTVDQLLDKLRHTQEIPDFSYYIFILENEFSNKLVGVLSNHDFLQADPRSLIDSIMSKKIISAYPMDPIKETLKKLYRYEVSAIPVVSKLDNKLLGICTFRDAISIYLPKRWKIRMRRIFNNGS